jgi:hypothetical protein
VIKQTNKKPKKNKTKQTKTQRNQWGDINKQSRNKQKLQVQDQ